MARINAVSLYENRSLEEICRLARDAGFDSIEISRFPFYKQLTTTGLRRAFAAWMKAQRLGMFGFDAWVDVQPYTARSATLEQFKDAIDFAADLDLGLIITHDGWRSLIGHRRRSQCLPILVRYFKRLADLAVQRGLDVVIEPHPDTLSMDTSFAVDLVDAVHRENVGLLYDSCHYGVGHPHSYIRAIEKLGSRIRHVHLADGDRRTYALHLPLGDGELDLKGIVQALREIRYRGTITNDLYNYPLIEDGARRSCARLREAESELQIAAV
jgi:sugar phosphate isomerase/epimerase